MRLSLTALTALCLTLGCASVDYSGEVYTPVADARVVQSRDELAGDYDVIGRAIASVPAGFSGSDLRRALEEKAEAVGAHAVVLGNFREVTVGAHLHWNYESYSSYPGWSREFGYDAWVGNPFAPHWYEPHVHYERELQLKALFLRRAPTPETSQTK